MSFYQQCRHRGVVLSLCSMILLGVVPTCDLQAAHGVVRNQSPGGEIPPGMSCQDECPGLGTRNNDLKQVVSPVSNPCSDMPLKLLLERWGATVNFPERQCPLWVMLTPPHSVVVPRQDCCLLERQSRDVIQQKLRCECTSFFIFCWSRSCLPAGEPIKWESVDHWVSLPCLGSGAAVDCGGGTP